MVKRLDLAPGHLHQAFAPLFILNSKSRLTNHSDSWEQKINATNPTIYNLVVLTLGISLQAHLLYIFPRCSSVLHTDRLACLGLFFSLKPPMWR